MKYLVNVIIFILVNIFNTTFIFNKIIVVILKFLWDFEKPTLKGLLVFGYEYNSLKEFYKHNQIRIK